MCHQQRDNSPDKMLNMDTMLRMCFKALFYLCTYLSHIYLLAQYNPMEGAPVSTLGLTPSSITPSREQTKSESSLITTLTGNPQMHNAISDSLSVISGMSHMIRGFTGQPFSTEVEHSKDKCTCTSHTHTPRLGILSDIPN